MQSDNKSNLAIMAIIYDFLSQLSEEQLNDLLEKRAFLKLGTAEDIELEALIEKKVEARIGDSLRPLVKQELESLMIWGGKSAAVFGNDSDYEPKAPESTTKMRNTTRKKAAVAVKSDTNKSDSKKPVDIEAEVLLLKTITTKKGLEEHFEAMDFSRGILQRIATGLGGIKDTNKASREELKAKISEVLLWEADV
jgi:hypothetical protein